jgi:hypothetical protein
MAEHDGHPLTLVHVVYRAALVLEPSAGEGIVGAIDGEGQLCN